jgi:glycosyltransferase involved in cell wall biosynthesis
LKPLVSILIPAYNAEKWIRDTLRSAVAQTWPRKEIIVIDDGSADGTLAAARRFESQGVQVFHQPNQGAAATRNTAFALSRGDYIQWLDADDLLSPNKISAQIAASNGVCSSRTLFSCTWGSFLYRPERARFRPSALWSDLSPRDWLVSKMHENAYMQTATWLVSRELAEAAGPWNTSLLGDDDGEYFCRVLLQSERIRFVPEGKVYYRAAGSDSLSHIGHCSRKQDAQWISMELHIKYLLSLETSSRTRAACIAYLQNWMTFFYPDRPDIFEEAQQLARGLGGVINAPSLGWKYRWLQPLLGESVAKKTATLLPVLRWSLYRFWDKQMARFSALDAVQS